MEETTFTLQMYQMEQYIRLAGRLPTLKEYWSYRRGSCCIGMVVAMIEYAFRCSVSDVGSGMLDLRTGYESRMKFGKLVIS